MAKTKFKQEAGDFADGSVHIYEKGILDDEGIFRMLFPSKFKRTKYLASQVIKIEEASQENISGFKWGAVGLVAFGALGLLAGALTGGTKTTFILEFDDGNSCMCTAKQKVFISMLAEVTKHQKKLPPVLSESDMKRKIIKNITSVNLDQWGIKTPSVDDAVHALDKLLYVYTPAEVDDKPELLIEKLKEIKSELLVNNSDHTEEAPQENIESAKETEFSSIQEENNSVPKERVNTEKKSIISTVISWIIGLLLILSSLGFMSFSLIGGIAILITGLLFLPPIHNLLLSLSNINLHWVLKSILALGFIFYSSIAVNDQIKEEFQADRATIISDIKNKLSDKDYLGASTLTYKYNSIKEDKELNDLRKQASNGVEEARLKKEADEKKLHEIADEKAEELKKIADAKEEKRKAEMIEKEKKQKEEERLTIKNKKKELLEPSGLLNSLTMKKETICDFAGFLVTRKLEKMFKGYSHNNSGCKVKVIKENSVEIESSYSTPFKLKPTMRYTARGTVDGVMLTLDKIKIHGEDKKFISFDNFPFE